jgi:hypothetical protein
VARKTALFQSEINGMGIVQDELNNISRLAVLLSNLGRRGRHTDPGRNGRIRLPGQNEKISARRRRAMTQSLTCVFRMMSGGDFRG